MITARRFEHERILLGSQKYEGCRFVDCELVVDGHPVQLSNNTFEDCHWVFEDAAGVTLDLIIALCRDDAEMRATFARIIGLGGWNAPTTLATTDIRH